MSKKIALLIVAVIALFACGCNKEYYDSNPAFKGYLQCSKTVFASGIVFNAALYGGESQEALSKMLEMLEEIDGEMNLSDSNSAISRFNALGAGESEQDYVSPKVEIACRTYQLIKLSLQYGEDTNGLFNIAVYPLTKLWHVDSEGLNEYSYASINDCPPPPDYNEVTRVKEYCSTSYLKTEENNGKYYVYKTHPELKIDLGAVAKGYAADECIQIAAEYGVISALIDISGNVCLLGDWYRADDKKFTRWDIGVTSPRPKSFGGNMCAISVGGNKTLVTSGDYMRYYDTMLGDSAVLSVPHILNGKTGLPLGIEYELGAYKNSADHIISATVITDKSAKADAYATALCLMSYSEAKEFMANKGLHGIIVTADDKMLLAGVTEKDESGEEYFTKKNDISGYKKYSLEEYAVG